MTAVQSLSPRADRAVLVELDDGRSALLPRHVTKCKHYDGPGASRDWALWVWDPLKPYLRTRVEYTCRSWRCDVCRRHEASVLWRRVHDALEGYDASDMVFLTLTLDRYGTYSGKPWKDEREAFRELSAMSRKFLKRVNRWCESQGANGIESRWVAVVEAHRSGWPHMHFVLVCPALAAHCREQEDAAKRLGLDPREGTLLHGALLDHATAVGWGCQSTAEAVRHPDRMASYLTKLAGELSKSQSGLGQLTQLPLLAPVRTRRLRSGRGFLPARHRGTMTGALVRWRTHHHSSLGYAVPMAPPRIREGETTEAFSERLSQYRAVCEAEETHRYESAALGEWQRRLRRAGYTGPPLARGRVVDLSPARSG